MEVHHHPDLHHNPKPWKEYFLEFIMIFLAVTLGFFAENIREKFTDKAKAREYAQSLYDDLRIDTAVIQRTYNEKKWIYAKFDSAQKILDAGEQTRYNEFIYYIDKYITFNDIFSSQDVTYQQLRGSGNFRYIRNIALYKKIADYYNLYSRYQAIDGTFGYTGQSEMSELESKVFNPKDLATLDNQKANNFYDLVLRPTGKFEPITTDKQSLRLFYIKLSNAKNRADASMTFLAWLKDQATKVILDIKEEYRF